MLSAFPALSYSVLATKSYSERFLLLFAFYRRGNRSTEKLSDVAQGNTAAR